ncbi:MULTISPECIES: hypothetical protein [Pseudomonas]|jgi:hypothetical protein|uniref:hypothetical protein n=1 Tax=Pseudomonas TaxID=286 RepID=UPI001F46F7EF|nr:hypothetical protein [Pseudomonas antarctica]
MTSTLFQSGQSAGRGAFHCRHILARSTSVNVDGASAALRKVHATEALRVKAFVGQRKFQAPVADDFIRGLLAPGHASQPDAKGLRQAHCMWAALTNGLAAWWRGQRPALTGVSGSFYMLLWVFAR